MLDDAGHDCVVRGYLLIPAAVRNLYAGEIAAAYDLFKQAGAIAERFRDPDLAALARMGEGRTLIKRGEPAEGMSLLDEAMAAVEAGEVSPIVAGTVYCGVVEGCTETFDVHRAREWTSALSRWCSVLRLVAQGKTNKAIASELFLREKTVHRHVSNIFVKLGLSTRAAATAYAFRHNLV